MYIISFGTFVLKDDVYCPIVKIGTTCYPHQRKWDYLTSSPNSPMYRALFTMECTPKMLYTLDGRRFRSYLQKRNLSSLCITNDGGVEWYYETENYIEIISGYLNSLGIIYNVIIGDNYIAKPRRKAPLEEATYKLLFEETKQYFLQHIISSFRSIQEEYWDMLSYQSLPFRGIVKLPTGTGKTLIVIISLVIARYIFNKPIRALIVCPQKNIFETTYSYYEKFSRAYGIPVHRCYGNYGSLSSFVDDGQQWVILATHQGCVVNDNIKRIPYNFILYDEVHRVTGPEFFEALAEVVDQKDFVIGTSATPFTDKNQICSLVKIFPQKSFLDCSYTRAIREKWIVKPRFDVTIKTDATDEELYTTLAEKVLEAIDEREVRNMNKGRKVLCYIPQNTDFCCKAYSIFRERIENTNIISYYANDEGEEERFLSANDNNWHVMYTCQKYREGSDIKGLEMNFMISGSKIQPYLLLQTAGRTLRNDYDGKEGWCHILKKSESGQSAESILLSIYEELIKDFDICDNSLYVDRKAPDKKNFDDPPNVRTNTINDFLGKITLDNKVLNREEALQTIENLYLRRDPNSYEALREYNISCKIRSKAEYFNYVEQGKYQIVLTKPEIITNPPLYFKDKWKSWYDYLGLDTYMYPQTYDEFVNKIRTLGLRTKRLYDVYVQDHTLCGLPKNPEDLYGCYTYYPKF